MKKMLISAGMALTTLASGVSVAALPTAAHAQSCEHSKTNDRVAGSLLGGLVGGLAGSVIGGDTLGGLVGAGVGAVGGNVIAGRRAGPCPSEYYARGYVPRSSYRSAYRHSRYRDDGYYRRSAYNGRYNRCGWEDQAYRDAYGNLVRRQVQVCR